VACPHEGSYHEGGDRDEEERQRDPESRDVEGVPRECSEVYAAEQREEDEPDAEDPCSKIGDKHEAEREPDDFENHMILRWSDEQTSIIFTALLGPVQECVL
jgi:hypothetical protein